MNLERMRILRDHLATLDDQQNVEFGFNMCTTKSAFIISIYDKSIHNCNTVGCIAGHACMLFGNEDQRNHPNTIDAAELLDVNYDKIDCLFYPYSYSYDKEINPGWEATPKQAAEAIDKFLAGKEPWPMKGCD